MHYRIYIRELSLGVAVKTYGCFIFTFYFQLFLTKIKINFVALYCTTKKLLGKYQKKQQI